MTLAELIAAKGAFAPALVRGVRVKKLLLCNTASCIAAREAGVEAGDRRGGIGKNYVHAELVGTAVCADCGTEWSVSPGAEPENL